MKIRVAKFYTESEGSHIDFSKKNLEQHKSKSQGIFFIKYVFEIHKIKKNQIKIQFNPYSMKLQQQNI